MAYDIQVKLTMRFKKIYLYYFLIKIFYLFFAIFIFSKLTTLGDTPRYLNSGVGFSFKVFYSSTELMDFLGNSLKKIFYFDIIACFPFLLLSFYGVYYAVKKLNLHYAGILLMILLSMPNFGIWTSILSKEAVGCFYSGILGVLIINFYNGNFKVKAIDVLALYLCFIFKPPYFVFIIQALIFLRIVNGFKFSTGLVSILAVFMLLFNVGAIYLFREEIDLAARALYVHFTNFGDPDLAKSTRENAFEEQFDFFRKMPFGMFISFFGPTVTEMLDKPTHLLSGIESTLILLLFFFLSLRSLLRPVLHYRFNPKLLFIYLLLFSGFLFSNYPFGILNPGSAVRYRENFYLIFVIMLVYLYIRSKMNSQSIKYRKLNDHFIYNS